MFEHIFLIGAYKADHVLPNSAGIVCFEHSGVHIAKRSITNECNFSNVYFDLLFILPAFSTWSSSEGEARGNGVL